MNILKTLFKYLTGQQFMLYMGGGSGGGGSGTGTQTQISELPEWARGYAKSTLEKGAALTEKPYQAYEGERIAGFSPLQQQAQAAAGPQGFQNTVGQYMSPYQQNVTDIQKREAARQSGIAGTQQAAQATQAGAFGGGRDAIMRAERERNLGQQMNDIQAQGSQNAFNAATQQYNTGLQQMSAFGGQQQALRQQGLNQAYQDFQNQQNYPYKQLGFFSDLVRGMPVGQVTSKSMYEPEPGMAQQIGSLGMGAYGLSKFMAYADGGSVDSTDNIERIVSKLSDQQLQQAAQAAQARGDADQLEAIQSEMGMRASERNGIAGGVTNAMADRMAGGGVVAFATGGLNDYMKSLSDLGNQDVSATPEERMAGIKGVLPEVQSLYGPSATAPYMEEIKKERAGLSKMKDQGEGLAFLAASQALLRPGSKSRAAAGAMGAFGAEIVKMDKEKREADRQLRQSELTLATAEQARADGQIGKAQDLYNASQAQKEKALDRKIGIAEKQAQIEGGIKQAQIGASATLGKKTDLERLTDAQHAALLEAGEPNNAATKALATQRAANLYGKMAGTTRADMAEATVREKAAAAVDTLKYQDPVWKEAKKGKDTEAMRAREQQMINDRMNKAPEGGGPAAAPQQSTAPIKVTTEAQFAKLAPGTTFIAPDGSTRIKQ